jgi:hypothetical protein
MLVLEVKSDGVALFDLCSIADPVTIYIAVFISSGSG